MNIEKNVEAVLKLINWVVANRDNFSHKLGKTTDEQLILLKPIGELALCCDLMIRGNLHSVAARELLEWAWLELDSGDFLKLALISRPGLMMISSLYATFYRNNIKNESLGRLIKNFSESEFSKSIQYPYWRRLDLNRALCDLEVFESLNYSPDLTWSYHRPEPWIIENDSAYALTHEVFYITNFGASPDSPTPATTSYIRTWLPAWKRIFLGDNNLDIFTELLMVSLCIGKPYNELVSFKIIAESISPSGFLPGPENGGKSLLSGIRDEGRSIFLQNYHTTLVGIMAFSLLESACPTRELLTTGSTWSDNMGVSNQEG